ncbi:hypothetical protein [Streptomyces sp. NPDC044948]
MSYEGPTCTTCHGSGGHTETTPRGDGGHDSVWRPCGTCHGRGTV